MCQRHPYLAPLSALLALKELLRPVSLDVHHDEALGVQQSSFFPLMPGTLRALRGSRDAPDEKLVGKLDDGELVNSELVDSQQQLNLHTLSFYS